MNHGTAILGMMFLVFLVLDQFNPMMNFTDNTISRWLLAALCLGAVARSILGWRQEGRNEVKNTSLFSPSCTVRYDRSGNTARCRTGRRY